MPHTVPTGLLPVCRTAQERQTLSDPAFVRVELSSAAGLTQMHTVMPLWRAVRPVGAVIRW